LVERLNYQVAIVEDVTPEFALGDLQLRVQPIRPVAVWWKLHGRVEAKRFRICDGGYAGGAEVEIAQSEASCFLAPDRGHRPGMRHLVEPIDDQQRPPFDADVAPVGEHRQVMADERPAVVLRVLLADQNFLIAAVPAPGPVLVCPADAEREFGLAAGDDFVERLLEQALPVEPVDVIAKAVDAELAR